jgi:dephospho-CoA kinase
VRRLAITGGVAAGKSTVLGYLRELGYETLSADDCAREVFEQDAIQDWLAEKLRSERPVPRAAVLEALASDPGLRRELNARTHPRIARQLLQSTAAVVEVPLLVEACMHGHFDRIWVVACSVDDQVLRLAKRGLGREEATQLIGTHLPTEAKCAFADRIVRTNQPEAHVHRFVADSIGRDLE